MSVKYPKIKFDSKQRIYVSFYLNNKDIGFLMVKRLMLKYTLIRSNKKRLEMGKLLAAEVYKFITSELAFNGLIPENKKQYCINDMQYFKLALENKLKGDYSLKYKSMLRFVYDKFLKETDSNSITSDEINSFLNQYIGVSYNTIKRHLNVLINDAITLE